VNASQGIIRIAVLAMMGAVLYDVLTHPKGTKTLIGGTTELFRTGLSAASGRGKL
jgi:hypothetical protein